MQGKISMDLSFCQSETGFSLDELVVKLGDVYERKAFGELLKMILQMVEVTGWMFCQFDQLPELVTGM